MSDFKIVYLIVERGMEPNRQVFWRSAGSAFVCRDGSLNVKLDIHPGLTFNVRDPKSYGEREEAAEFPNVENGNGNGNGNGGGNGSVYVNAANAGSLSVNVNVGAGSLASDQSTLTLTNGMLIGGRRSIFRNVYETPPMMTRPSSPMSTVRGRTTASRVRNIGGDLSLG